MNTVTPATKKFALTRKNQKGQVAIFVALIFQVVFVFFALLINVGLLVHHKINLQQSTDLAAYYGAMKQAEMLNAVSHINFQIRQSWKLLTWRYRVLGTFGFQDDQQAPGPSQKFPFDSSSASFQYFAEQNTKCLGPANVAGRGVQDIPFFCVGHGGFKGWPSSDTSCRVSCNTFSSAKVINSIPNIGNATTIYGGTGAPEINALISTVNTNQAFICNELSKFGSTVLARFMASYIIETTQRKATIEMLAANLSADFEKQIDLDGGKILEGVKKTFKNNLTEANQAKIENITALNGLSQGECSYENGKASSAKKEFLKKIEFEFINYFIHHCEVKGAGKEYKPESLFDANGKVNAKFNLDPAVKTVLESVFNQDQLQTVGFEKNPNCIEYYAVKASTTPKIPFLPIEAVTLNAISIFKPFGGSVGPWFGNKWNDGDAISSYEDNNDLTKIDKELPFRKTPSANAAVDIFGTKQQLNFSLFVGDTKGVSDSRYIAAYHSLLAKRDLPNNISFYNPDFNSDSKLKNPNEWPAYTNWTGIDSISNPDTYDSLAAIKTGTRALEISAVAPNQFDLTYFSIDPDFYHNYFIKIYKNFDALKSAADGKGPNDKRFLRPDFGAKIDTSILSQSSQPVRPPLDAALFSVKDQIYLKNLIFNKAPDVKMPNGPNRYSDAFPYLASAQSNVLTGWTFSSFSDYKKFPDEPLSSAVTMSFAQCKDGWNKVGSVDAAENFETPAVNGAQYPPVPGNCVTGGRTGYSVKMVTPSMISSVPPNGEKPILNPIPNSFLSF